MGAVTVFRQALPAMVVGRMANGEVPPLGLGEPFALRGGDQLGADGIRYHLSHEWQPDFLDAVTAACETNIAAERPWFGMPPIALAGPEGAGRTHAARALANAAGVPHAIVDLSDPLIAANLGATREIGEALWISSVVAAMAATRCANPVVSVIGAETAGGDVIAALASMLDPAQNRAWREDQLGAVVDLGEVAWVVQCRDVDALPNAIRALVHPVSLVTPDIRFDSLVGLSVLMEVERDLHLDISACGLGPADVLKVLHVQSTWPSVGSLYSALRGGVPEAIYQAAVEPGGGDKQPSS